MRRLLLIVVAGLLLALFSACQQPIDLEAEREALLQVERDFAAVSAELGPAEAFYRYFAEDVVQLVTGLDPVFGREAVYQIMKGEETYTLTWEPEDARVSSSADLGWTWGFYTGTYPGESGDTLVYHGKYLSVWKKVEGQWKIAADIGNSSPAPE
jgi:ketosteroid isomerase-like protein